jgi:DeoR family transcriptional regulator of aga operon
MTDRAILSIAHQVIIVADHKKFGRASSVFVGPASDVHVLITDTETPQEFVMELRELGIDVKQV